MAGTIITQDLRDDLRGLRSLRQDLKATEQDLALLRHAVRVADATCAGLCSFVELRLQMIGNRVNALFARAMIHH